MSKKKKVYKLTTLEDIGDVITEKNFTDLTECIMTVLTLHVKAKALTPEIKLRGLNWQDDGNNEITGININFK